MRRLFLQHILCAEGNGYEAARCGREQWRRSCGKQQSAMVVGMEVAAKNCVLGGVKVVEMQWSRKCGRQQRALVVLRRCRKQSAGNLSRCSAFGSTRGIGGHDLPGEAGCYTGRIEFGLQRGLHPQGSPVFLYLIMSPAVPPSWWECDPLGRRDGELQGDLCRCAVPGQDLCISVNYMNVLSGEGFVVPWRDDELRGSMVSCICGRNCVGLIDL